KARRGRSCRISIPSAPISNSRRQAPRERVRPRNPSASAPTCWVTMRLKLLTWAMPSICLTLVRDMAAGKAPCEVRVVTLRTRGSSWSDRSLLQSDEVARHSPPPRPVKHGDDRLHHLVITRDVRLVLEKDVLARWCIREVEGVSGHDLASCPERLEGPAGLLHCLHPLRLRHGELKR